MSVNTYFSLHQINLNSPSNQSSVEPQALGRGVDKKCLKVSSRIFTDIMLSLAGYGEARELIFGYLDLPTLATLQQANRACYRGVNDYLFARSIYDISLPFGTTEMRDFAQFHEECTLYKTWTSQRVPREFEVDLDVFFTNRIAEILFKYVLLKDVKYEEGTENPIDTNRSALELSREIAEKLVGGLIPLGLMEFFTTDPFEDTSHFKLRDRSQIVNQIFDEMAQFIVSFVQKDAGNKLSDFLAQGKRFNHAKNSQDLAQRLQASFDIWRALSPIARTRAVYAVTEKWLSGHPRLDLNPADALKWLTNEQGDFLSDEILSKINMEAFY